MKQLEGGLIGKIPKKNLALSRTKASIPKKANDLVKKLQFRKNKYIISSESQIYGSFNYQLQPYPSDIDSTNKVIYKKDLDEDVVIKMIAIELQNIVKKISRQKSYTITDLKCGVYENGEPIHWTAKEIKQGYREPNIKDNTGNSSKYKITLTKALEDLGTMVKLDMVAPYMGKYIEITSLYQIYLDKLPLTKLIEDDDNRSLSKDTTKQFRKNKIFKVIKRIYSNAKIRKDTNTLRFIEPLINSNLSKLASYKGEFETILLILENDKFPTMTILNQELDNIKFGLDNILDIKFDKDEFYKNIDKLKLSIKEKKKKNSIKICKKIKDNLNDLINKETLDYLKSKGINNIHLFGYKYLLLP